MTSQLVCRETPECNGLVNKTSTCEKCGKPCQEELTTGEIVIRQAIPEYTLRDLNNIEAENAKLINEFIVNSEGLLMTQRGLSNNLDRRIQLQKTIQNKIQNGLRKARLDRDKEVKWGYDPFKKTFVGLRKPKSKVIDE